jgi:hypothetical protein
VADDRHRHRPRAPARIHRARLLADELQAAAEDVAIYLAATAGREHTWSTGTEYRRRAARREAAFQAVVDAIEGASRG